MRRKHESEKEHTNTASDKLRLKLGRRLQHKGWIIVGIAIAAIVILILAIALGRSAHRTESYEKVSGGAGLNAEISYDCMSACERKFDFNIYILNADGQQVAVVRPDKNGKLAMALPEGKYVMLIGKRLLKDELFPQEAVTLRSGQELRLKLYYKEGAS